MKKISISTQESWYSIFVVFPGSNKSMDIGNLAWNNSFVIRLIKNFLTESTITQSFGKSYKELNKRKGWIDFWQIMLIVMIRL